MRKIGDIASSAGGATIDPSAKPTVVSQKLLAREGRHGERHLCQYNQIGNAVPPLLRRAVVSARLASSVENRDTLAA